MQKIFLDYFPAFVFLAVYLYSKDMFLAVGVFIAASIVQIAYLLARKHKVEKMHWIQLIAVVVLGGLTIAFANQAFIRWKPTVVYWVFAAILVATQFIGERTAAERLLGKQIELPARIWRRMNISFAMFCLAMGFLNLYVAFVYGSELDPKVQEEHWVYFKVFGTMILTFVFLLIVMMAVSRHITEKPAPDRGGTTKTDGAG